MDADTLTIKLVEFIGKQTGKEIGIQTELLYGGYIDSFRTIEIIVFVEDILKRKIDPDDIDMSFFTSIPSLVGWLVDHGYLESEQEPDDGFPHY